MMPLVPFEAVAPLMLGSMVALLLLGFPVALTLVGHGFLFLCAGALLGFYIGQHFDGTVVPLTLGFALCGLAALVTVLVVERGRLFHPAPGRA